MFCLLVVVVSKAAREKLKYALRVPFCIAPPSHCVLWQQPGLIWGLRAGQPPAPLEWKNSGAQINKNEYHTRTASFFYAVFFYTSRNGAALAARVLWGHKREFFDLLIWGILGQNTFCWTGANLRVFFWALVKKINFLKLIFSIFRPKN